MKLDTPYKSHGYCYFFLARLKDYLVYGQFKLEETEQNKHMHNQRVSTIPIEDWDRSFDGLEPTKGHYIKELNELKKLALMKLFTGWLRGF